MMAHLPHAQMLLPGHGLDVSDGHQLAVGLCNGDWQHLVRIWECHKLSCRSLERLWQGMGLLGILHDIAG